MLVIFLTVFIDLIGFGIVVPLIPIYSREFGGNGWIIAAVIASYSAMQFVFSPIWGKLSDRYGRRPILLISTAGAAISYVIFAMASLHGNLWLLFASRLFAGACGGNITVAQAYVADISKPEERSKKMGLIGMAFGLGFIFGPAISGVMNHFYGPTAPGWAAAALCALNFFLTFFILAESLKPESIQAANRPRFAQWGHTLSQPKIGLLILLFFLATFAFSCFECTLGLLIMDQFKLGGISESSHSVGTITSLFIFCGLISAMVQGGAIGKLVKKFGEPKLIAASMLMTGVSLVLLPLVHGSGPLKWSALIHDLPWIEMLAVLALLAFGSSLSRAPLFGLLSNLTPANEQGATIGVAQSAGSLARILGPLFANPLYMHSPLLPYAICGAISILAGMVALPQLMKK